MKTADFNKSPNGLLPAIIQDVITQKVLMLGYMNEEALEITQSSGKVTFFSRSRQRLWTKGEESGNLLTFKSFKVDCDQDALLVYAEPLGPTCHTGKDTCWEEDNENSLAFLNELEVTIALRQLEVGSDSYVANLFKKGINKIAQKVGEEAVETVIEAKDNNEELFINESADLLFHLLILLRAKGHQLSDVVKILKTRKR